jgi:hypothetical protein
MMLLVVFVVPVLGLAIFLIISLVHFGTVDVAYHRWRRGEADRTGPPGRFDLMMQTLAYGGS